MQATQITLRNLRSSTALQGRIRLLREHLERFHPHIVSCRIAIERAGPEFGVHLKVLIPGREIAVTRTHHEDVYAALGNAFDIARRELIVATGKRSRRNAQADSPGS